MRSCIVIAIALAGCGNDRARPTEVEDPLPARLRLLTDTQYVNAVHDLLGDVELPELRTAGAPPHQFIHEEILAVDAPQLVQYRLAAELVGRQVALRPDPLACAGRGDDCAAAAIETLASRAFRRPLATEERDQLVAMDLDGGIGMVVEAVLQAPGFVYRTELGEAQGDLGSEATELTAFELSAAVSFLLLDSIPDDDLWAAAKDGSVLREDVLAAEVERLLALPRVQAHIDDVVLDWLEVRRVLTAGKDLTKFPEINDALRGSMLAETAAFVHDVLWNRRGSLRELLSSSRTFVDARLAPIYGVEVTSETPVAIELDRRGRAGVLTHASLLTSLANQKRESIIQRGVYVNRHFLCLPEPGRPPFAAIIEVAGFTNKLSESQFAHYRAANAYCMGCHRSIDPAGRALESYDGIGRLRTVDEVESPIENDTTLRVDGKDTSLVGALALAELLAESPQVANCVADQFAHHALGRELGETSYSRELLLEQFDSSDHDLVELFRSIATSPAFRARRRVP